MGLAPNAFVALGELGVGGILLARAFAPTSGELRRPDGRVLKRAEIPAGQFGGPLVVALRPALHGALLDAVGTDSLTLQSEATGFALADDGVTLRLASGETAEGDLLVGADGIGSVIRRTLHPAEPPPRSSGLIAVRGVVHGALHHLGDRSAIYYLGRGVESMFVRASDTGIYWFLSLPKTLLPSGIVDPRAIVAHMAPRFDATFRAITSATDDWRADELFDRDPLPAWGRSRVTLVGDAAHPVLPHTGQGAAQAIVDAVTLGKMLTPKVDLESTLRAFEAERQAKTSALVRQGRRTASFMRIRNPVACYVREMVLRMLPLKPLMKAYLRVNHRAGTDVEA